MTRRAVLYCCLAGLIAVLGGLLAGCSGGPVANEVVVYTAEKDENIDAVSRLWAQAHPDIKMRTVASGTNEIVQRVKAERRRPLGDLVWGVGAEGLAANPDLYEMYQTSEEPAVDPEWVAVAKGEPWLPNNVVPTVLVYNTKLVPAAKAPQTWRDLADPRWKGKVAYAAPDKSGSAYTQLATMVAVFGDNPAGWKTIEQIMDNAVILQSSSKVPKGVADGEYEVGLSYENVVGVYVNGGAPVKIVYPADGTSVTPDGNALIKGGPHPENAKLFLDFLQSKAVQEELATKLSLRSVRTDVAPPPGLPALSAVKRAPGFDFRWSTDHRADFLGKWQEILLRRG